MSFHIPSRSVVRVYASFKGEPPIELWRGSDAKPSPSGTDMRTLTDGMSKDWRVWTERPLPDAQAIGRRCKMFDSDDEGTQKTDDVDLVVEDMREARPAIPPTPDFITLPDGKNVPKRSRFAGVARAVKALLPAAKPDFPDELPA